MIITTAILEFLVIGSLWAGVILVSFGLLCIYTPLAALPITDSDDLRLILSLASIPFAYLIGVIAQGATWSFWYLPRFHAPALQSELDGRHGRAYQAIYSVMRRHRYPMASLAGAGETLTEGKQLGFILDLLRVELLHAERAEMAHQYQIQFHLYRLLYGSIPALFALSLTLFVGTILDVLLGSLHLAPIFLLGALVGLFAGVLAFPVAAHRRERLWKYLRLGANLTFGKDLASALEEHEQGN